MMRRLSDAAKRLVGQQMFQILAEAQALERDGVDVLHFEIGDPDFSTPENISRVACEALMGGETHYTDSKGLLELREAAVDVTSRSRGFSPDIEQILVTPGANAQLYYAIACAVNPGEEVIIPDPSFVSYESIIRFLGAVPVKVPLLEENEFRINPTDVEEVISSKTRMIIINSPHNPTGAVMTQSDMDQIFSIAEREGLYLVSDEIYARMIYHDADTRFYSPSLRDKCKRNTIVINGFSKSYAMTGWRLGVVMGPADLISKMGLLLETTTSCVAPFLQLAGVEALKGSQEPIDEMMSRFRLRRDLIFNGLNSLPGITCLKPKGAFYAFPNIKKTGYTSAELTKIFLEKAGVAVAPGTIFGEFGESYIRLCFANSEKNIESAIVRMDKVLRT